MKSIKTHCFDEGLDIIPRDNLKFLIELSGSYLQKGRYRYCFRIMGDEKGYRFVAYPGPNVVDKGRAEHKPLHFHVKHNQYEELRIRTEDFREMGGITIPRRLRMIWDVEIIRNILAKQTESVYETGKLLEF